VGEEGEEEGVPSEVVPTTTERVSTSSGEEPVPVGLRARLPSEPQEPLAPTGELRCKYCKSTTNLDGRPFTNLGQLGWHARDECPEYKKIRAAKGEKTSE